MSTHTPGPLRVLQNSKNDSEATAYLVVSDAGERPLAIAKFSRAGDAELFAAAPDLLESLNDALAFIVAYAAVYQHQHALTGTHPEHQKVIDKCLAAIAKAEGKS